MKKAKNEAVAQGNAKNAESKQKNKSVQTEKNNPSDKKEKETAEYPFKKVIYGYDPEEVAAYIAELNIFLIKHSSVRKKGPFLST